LMKSSISFDLNFSLLSKMSTSPISSRDFKVNSYSNFLWLAKVTSTITVLLSSSYILNINKNIFIAWSRGMALGRVWGWKHRRQSFGLESSTIFGMIQYIKTIHWNTESYRLFLK
jgi:hypothetical protein